jgi:hypothetical protein
MALFAWQKQMERKTVAVTGDVIWTAAAKLWNQLSRFQDITLPKWSAGWLHNFKLRCGFKKHTKHGEAVSVNTEHVKTQLETLYEQLCPYSKRDIYNMDEIALYWKTVPDSTLATVQMAGGKVTKARITANFCCNASGTDKLPIWFIRRAAKPRCFTSSGVNMSELQAV